MGFSSFCPKINFASAITRTIFIYLSRPNETNYALRLSGSQALRLSGSQALRLSGSQALRLSGSQALRPALVAGSVFHVFSAHQFAVGMVHFYVRMLHPVNGMVHFYRRLHQFYHRMERPVYNRIDFTTRCFIPWLKGINLTSDWFLATPSCMLNIAQTRNFYPSIIVLP